MNYSEEQKEAIAVEQFVYCHTHWDPLSKLTDLMRAFAGAKVLGLV